ncbi:glutaredoxin [Trichinella spiralis]|uniref:glutaredoxin n=1 Tax=Trichinella spiralis TaxID=6334 RepID=UPI0001EFD8DC|nr:glutaredoxin [Trichinella spiralis]
MGSLFAYSLRPKGPLFTPRFVLIKALLGGEGGKLFIGQFPPRIGRGLSNGAQGPAGKNMKDALEELTGARSVPRVFIDGKFIGGADDTKRLHENGELSQMLENLHLIKPTAHANKVHTTTS